MGNEIKLSAQELFKKVIAEKTGVGKNNSDKIDVGSIFNFKDTSTKNTRNIDFNSNNLTNNGSSVSNSEVISAIKDEGLVNIFAIDGKESDFSRIDNGMYDFIAEISNKSNLDDKADKLLELLQEQFLGDSNTGINRDISQIVDSICSKLDISDKASVLELVKEFAGDGYLSLSDFENYSKNGGVTSTKDVDGSKSSNTATSSSLQASNSTATNINASNITTSSHGLNINSKGIYNLNDSLYMLNRDLNKNAETQDSSDSLSDNATTLVRDTQKQYLDTYIGKGASGLMTANSHDGTNQNNWFSWENKNDGYTNCARVVNDNGVIKIINTIISPNKGEKPKSNVYELKYGGLEGDDVKQSTSSNKPSFGDDYVNSTGVKDLNGNTKDYSGYDGLYNLATDVYGKESMETMPGLSQEKVQAALTQRNADIEGIQYGKLADNKNVYLPSAKDIANWNMDKNPAFYAQGDYATKSNMSMVENYQGAGTRAEAVVKDGWSSYKSGKSSISTTDILKDFYNITDTGSPIAQKIISDLKSIYNISGDKLPDNLDELVLPNPYADYSDFKLRESGSGSKPSNSPSSTDPMDDEAKRLPGALYDHIKNPQYSGQIEKIRNSDLYQAIKNSDIDNWQNYAAKCTRTVYLNNSPVKYYEVKGQWYDNEGYRTQAPTKKNGRYVAN